jgi:outer membrane protein, adhesin transport system
MNAQKCAVILGLGLLALQGASPVFAENLGSVVRRTLDTNPELKALMHNRNAIDEELEAAKGLGLPSVDVRAAAGHRASEGSSVPAGGAHSYRERNRYEAGATISQRLFDGFETKSQVERQLNRVGSARSRVADTANAVALQATQAYLEIQRTTQVKAIASRNVAAHQALLEKVKARTTAGRGAGAEVNQAQARLLAARSALTEADARNKDAVSLFIAVVGSKPPAKLQAVKPPSNLLPKNVDEAVSHARKGSPAIIARMFDAQAASLAINVAKSEFYPKINAEFSADYAYDVDRTYGRRTDVSGMVVYRQNLYRGGIDSARVREARSRSEEAFSSADLIGRTVEREVRFSWTAMHSARTRSDIISRQLEQNRSVFKAYGEQFELGQRTLIDLLDVQNESFVNETTLATETFVSQFNVYRVLASMGRLVPALGAEYPEEARRIPLPSAAIIP